MKLKGKSKNRKHILKKSIMYLPFLRNRAIELAKIQKEIEELNKYSICGKNELKWEVQKNYANFFSLALVGLEQLYEEYEQNQTSLPVQNFGSNSNWSQQNK